jgi:hypothetical protein
MPFIGPFTSAEALRSSVADNVFHVRASYLDEIALIVKQLSSPALNKRVVLRQSDGCGQAGPDGAAQALCRFHPHRRSWISRR